MLFGEGEISIHAPLAGSDDNGRVLSADFLISIHAPLAGSDTIRLKTTTLPPKFQSTLPSRGATRSALGYPVQHGISIHAPLAGSDSSDTWNVFIDGDFNPRSPRGERLFLHHNMVINLQFQSTLPSRGATRNTLHRLFFQLLFQSTLPSRGAT